MMMIEQKRSPGTETNDPLVLCPGPVIPQSAAYATYALINTYASRFVGYIVKHTLILLIWSELGTIAQLGAQTHNTKRILHKHPHSIQLLCLYLASNCECTHISCSQSPGGHPAHRRIFAQYGRARQPTKLYTLFSFRGRNKVVFGWIQTACV